MNTTNTKATNTKTALISTYNKEGMVNFAKGIRDAGYKIISTSGTAKELIKNDLFVE